MSSTLYYIHDPMCSWCWGFAATFKTLEDTLPANIQVVRVLGGLAEDSDVDMPEAMQNMLQETWKQIESTIPGTKFNHDFWVSNKPRRSTWPSCRAVIAARNQDPAFEAPMTLAIQEAYYLQAKNPSNTDVLTEIARQIGCDAQLFTEEVHSEKTRNTLLSEMRFSRELGVHGFPSIRIKTSQGQLFELPVSYGNPTLMLDQIEEQTSLRSQIAQQKPAFITGLQVLKTEVQNTAVTPHVIDVERGHDKKNKNTAAVIIAFDTVRLWWRWRR